MYAPLLSDNASCWGTVAWVIIASLIAWRGMSWLWRGCWRGLFRLWCGVGSDVMFFPDKSGRNVARICREFARSRRRLWLAVFTLTDDVVSTEVLKAHAR